MPGNTSRFREFAQKRLLALVVVRFVLVLSVLPIALLIREPLLTLVLRVVLSAYILSEIMLPIMLLASYDRRLGLWDGLKLLSCVIVLICLVLNVWNIYLIALVFGLLIISGIGSMIQQWREAKRHSPVKTGPRG
jgi:hypothetical protein